ncbi:unnamed protein product, partial [Staurois parvus]
VHTQKYTRTDTCTYTNTHVHTYTCTCIHTNTHTYMYTHTDTCTYIHTNTCTHIHMYIHTDTCTCIYRHTCTHTPPIKKLQYFVVHSQSRVLHSRGRQRAQHTLLCFHCAQLLSSLTAPSANDRSGLSSEPAQQDGPEGQTRPHHNFHSLLASR